MTDLKADVDRFPEAGAEWRDIAAALAVGHTELQKGLDEGWRFGELALDIGKAHDAFIASMYAVLNDGSRRCEDIASLLKKVARDFGMTDEEQAAHLRHVGNVLL